MHRTPLVFAALLALSPLLHAQDVHPAVTADADVRADERVLDTSVVRAPGPGLWKVTRGDNTLWILGTVSPLPAGMVWNTARARAVVATADAVIREPSVTVGADVGFFGKLALVPSLVGIRDLPGDASLRDVLPPATYARWAVLRQRYGGSESKAEQWRPIFAAGWLYQEALKRRGLAQKNVVWPAVADAMKARDLKATVPMAKLTLADPKKVVKEFKGTQLADVRCFERLLDRVENDLDMLQARGDAWANGDVATLRRLDRTDATEDCEDALLSGAFAQKYGIDKLKAQARAKWISEAETSLASRRTALAVLPMHEVLAPGGLVAMLAAKGYAVEAPDAPATPPAP